MPGEYIDMAKKYCIESKHGFYLIPPIYLEKE